MLSHTPGRDAFERIAPLTDETLFGVWVADDGTAWAVGGALGSAALDRGVLPRYGTTP